MAVQKQLWVLAGGNGVGKSTFYHTQLESYGLPFINADIIAREIYPDKPEQHSYDAAKVAEGMRYQLLQEGRNFCFETVFSHTSKIDFIALAKAFGYQIILVFIHLEPLALNLARIDQRVQEGGHSVPTNKVINRIPRLFENIKSTLILCDEVRILDNSLAEDPFRQMVTIRNGSIERHVDPLPAWCQDLIN